MNDFKIKIKCIDYDFKILQYDFTIDYYCTDNNTKTIDIDVWHVTALC